MKIMFSKHKKSLRVFVILLIGTLFILGSTDPTNKTPTAEAGDNQTVIEGTTVSLNGSGSDSDGNIVSYSWNEGTTNLSSSATFNKVFTVGPHTLTLTVTDNDGAWATDTVTIIVTDKYPYIPKVIDNSVAVRFLNKATFGANKQSIIRLQQLGVLDWLNEQLNMPINKNIYLTKMT